MAGWSTTDLHGQASATERGTPGREKRPGLLDKGSGKENPQRGVRPGANSPRVELMP